MILHRYLARILQESLASDKTCKCDKCVVAGQNVYLGPTIHLPRPKYCFESQHSYLPSVVYYSFRIRFQRGAVIPMCSPRSELPITLVASRPDDAFIDLIPNSFLRVIIITIAVKIAF